MVSKKHITLNNTRLLIATYTDMKNVSYLWLPWLWQSAGERIPFLARVLQLLEGEEKLKVYCWGLTRLR